MDLLVCVPLFDAYFISANVEVRIRKELGHLGYELVEEFVGGFAGGIHHRIENSPPAFNLVGAWRAGKFRISDEPGSTVPGHIKFRNYTNAAIARVTNQISNFELSVIVLPGTHLLKLRELFTLETEALIVGEMQVQHVHLDRCHPVNVAF